MEFTQCVAAVILIMVCIAADFHRGVDIHLAVAAAPAGAVGRIDAVAHRHVRASTRT
jgi:hypothetical protein